MVTADLTDKKLISEEISLIKEKLSKLSNTKNIVQEDITDSECEYVTDNGTDDEQNNKIIEKPKVDLKQSEIKEQLVDLKIEEPIEDDITVEEIEPVIKIQENKKEKTKSIDLKKFVKREVKQHLNCFELNIQRLLKKYKNVTDLSEVELLKIQSKYNIENRYFNKKSTKLLATIEHYGGLDDDEYKKLNKRTAKINKKFIDFVNEFIDSSSASDSD